MLETLHKKAIRHVSLAKYNAHTSYLYKSCNLLNFWDLITMQKALFMHNFRYDRLPDSFLNFFTYNNDHSINRLREEDSNFLIKTNSSPLYNCASTWNRLPSDIKNIRKTTTFKNSLKDTLINKYEENCDKLKCFTCHPEKYK